MPVFSGMEPKQRRVRQSQPAQNVNPWSAEKEFAMRKVGHERTIGRRPFSIGDCNERFLHRFRQGRQPQNRF